MSLKNRLNLSGDPVFLIDGSAFIYRGFFAGRNMQRSDGFPTSAIVVVTRILLRILRNERPRHVLFVKDGKGKNFRHELYPLYKANRDATPEDLVRQMEPVMRMARALGVAVEVSEGCEADDCIASLAERFRKEHPVVIVSGDKDLQQCLSHNVYMWDPATGEEKICSAAAFAAEKGVPPDRWPDMQAVIGDTSDNIPGVPGIGPKTAKKIFEICPSLEDIRDRFSALPPKIQDKLRDHLESIFLWRRLTTLSRDFCAHLRLEDLCVRPADAEECRALAREFELHALWRDMEGLIRQQSADTAAENPAQAAPPAPHGMREAPRTGTAVQSSLLDLPAQSAVQAVRDAAQLPDCHGLNVALLPADNGSRGFHVAVQEKNSLLWGGSTEELCRWAGSAQRVVTPDLKALLVTDACWQNLLRQSAPAFFFDLGLAAYILNPEESDYGWPRLAVRWRGQTPETERGAAAALPMMAALEERLAADGLLELYQNLELPLVPVLAEMEKQGVGIDAAAFRTFLDEVQAELDRLTHVVHTIAGKPFNIRSAQQLGEILYTALQLPSPRKTSGGQASTSQETLEKLAGQHVIIENILQFRKLEKMRSTYLAPLPRIIDARGRIHTTFNQKATATGRLSSSNPNLQNIPVRGPLGKRMRSCFVAGKDHLFVSADYSQVELRVLAHMSRDAALLAAFRDGEDIHTRTAALVYDVPPDAVSADQRRNAKTINFGLIYGMGAQKLAQELKIPGSEAREFIARYFARLSGLKAFYESVENSAREQGYVTTLGGRRRHLPDILSANGQAQALARRQAINTVIQGSAADIIKLAMLAVAHDAHIKSLGARIILQVHDELLLETPANTVREVGMRVAELMESVRPGGEKLLVPLAVDWGTGPDWGAAH